MIGKRGTWVLFQKLSSCEWQKKPTMPVAECFYFTRNSGVSSQDQITKNLGVKKSHRTTTFFMTKLLILLKKQSGQLFGPNIFRTLVAIYIWRPLVLHSDPKSENAQGRHSDNYENIFYWRILVPDKCFECALWALGEYMQWFLCAKILNRWVKLTVSAIRMEFTVALIQNRCVATWFFDSS